MVQSTRLPRPDSYVTLPKPGELHEFQAGHGLHHRALPCLTQRMSLSLSLLHVGFRRFSQL